MAMIFGDYVAGFLGLARDGSGWSMNPFDVSFAATSIVMDSILTICACYSP